ncbi:C69 family dipeptidase [Flavihumibacter rivuli]|uniref:C69 family dipeptidase n=1 Tax=Flavihumibacter rivuli TaxID=2838156 RepID=UPI001BDDDE80|nr:C69 family dipeptidase [Flavihumibacter rivuli]ULQ56947.1 C69 family dipeptidase [Flavihumibacter rivuli]
MCDTFYIPPHLTRDGQAIFAKNSDREPNEAQHLVRYPRQFRDTDEVKATYITVPHNREIFEVILSKPFQMWGAEMGINENQVVIGNEAVFTRMPIARKNDGLTGMDLIRLALETSRSAEAALRHICRLVESYGQDACGGYTNRNFFYHNSFIIADPREAYVLETAGRFWVYRKLRSYYAISNRLSITHEWDGISDGAIDFAGKKGWSKGMKDFSFADAFSAPLMSRLSMAVKRRECSMMHLGSLQGTAGLQDAFKVLRSHAVDHGFDPSDGRMDSLCLHATGLLTPSQTTGSMVTVLRKDAQPSIWATGSSAPCLSVFKPFYFDDDVLDGKNFRLPSARADQSYWWQWERWHRKALCQYTHAHELAHNLFYPLEDRWVEFHERSKEGDTDRAILRKASAACVSESLDLLGNALDQLKENGKYRGWFYRYHWRKWNREAGIK